MILPSLRQHYHKYWKKQEMYVETDTSSMRYLIKRPLSQSQSVRLGIELEDFLRDFILNHNSTGWVLAPSRSIAKKQCDHLFHNRTTNQTVYAEIKCNLNLDTEKSVQTMAKCRLVQASLRAMYPYDDIRMCLVGLRYCTTDSIHTKIRRKFKDFGEHVYGVNEYLGLFGIDGFTSEEEYSQFLNEFVEVIF